MYYPWFEEYCLAKLGAVKEPADVKATALVGDSLGVPPAFCFMIGEWGLSGRRRFVFQNETILPALQPNHFYESRSFFRFTQDGTFTRPFIDLKLTPAAGDFFCNKYEDDIFYAYDVSNKVWHRGGFYCGLNVYIPDEDMRRLRDLFPCDVCIPDEIMCRLIDLSGRAFQSMPAPVREALPSPEKICSTPYGSNFCTAFRDYNNVRKESWNRICIDGRVPDEVMRHLIDISYTIAFQSMPAQAREAITGPEKICPKPKGRYCRLCSILCASGNKYPWLETYCLAKADTDKYFNEETQTLSFRVYDKRNTSREIFAKQSRDNTGRPVITLQLPPAVSEPLRRQFRDIIPGYFMNKARWNSVYLDGSVPDEVLRDMLDQSYAIISASVNRR